MTICIRQIHPVFVGEVEGVDLRRPLSAEDVEAIEAGMDRYAVLVFHDQPLSESSRSPSAATSARSSSPWAAT
jgi:alpha-ketoglutarate-dependent 2,4-dichlorophenoxyacetate dioxygenase